MNRTFIRGVDEPLPEGENLLWQGSPATGPLARHALKSRWIVGYFVLLAAFAAFTAEAGTVLPRTIWLAALAAVTVGLVRTYAWLVARTTVYAITDRRVLMRIGVAFPSIFNAPLSMVGEAYVRRNSDGSGDIALEIRGSERVGYAFLWPHTRPRRLADPQPMLRGLQEVQPAAEILKAATLAAQDGVVVPEGRRPVLYSVMDDDGIQILSNARPGRTREPVRT